MNCAARPDSQRDPGYRGMPAAPGHCPLSIAALSVESVIILLALLVSLGAWQARIHAASVAAARRPATRRPEYSQPR
jgi:hypothetical protein